MSRERREALQQGRVTPEVVADAVVAQTSMGIWLLDCDDCTLWVNPRMAEIVGSTPEQMAGAPVYDFLDSVSAEHKRDALRRRREGTSELREVELHRADG